MSLRGREEPYGSRTAREMRETAAISLYAKRSLVEWGGQTELTALGLCVRSWPRAKSYPEPLSHSVDKFILLTGGFVPCSEPFVMDD